MPLLDHFHPPLMDLAPWSSINSYWVVALAKFLDRSLPADRYKAYASVFLGNQAEANVAEYEQASLGVIPTDSTGFNDGAAVATLTKTASTSVTDPDEFEVQIHDIRDGMRLSAVIEILSPRNKDREQARWKFLGKCISYLHDGVGVVLVDIITSRASNFHNELMDELEGTTETRMLPTPSYVAAYKPNQLDTTHLDIWSHPARVGMPLPSVPVPLRHGPMIALDLEGTYTEVMSDHRLL